METRTGFASGDCSEARTSSCGIVDQDVAEVRVVSVGGSILGKDLCRLCSSFLEVFLVHLIIFR